MLDDQWEELDQDEAPPVDMLAAFFEARGWSVNHVGDDELSVEIKGNWTSYQMRAIWRDEDHVLQILLLPEIRVPDEKKTVIYETLGLINEQLWLGHFDLSGMPPCLAAAGCWVWIRPRRLSIWRSRNGKDFIRCSSSSCGATRVRRMRSSMRWWIRPGRPDALIEQYLPDRTR